MSPLDLETSIVGTKIAYMMSVDDLPNSYDSSGAEARRISNELLCNSSAGGYFTVV
jgi:hypothetical protein